MDLPDAEGLEVSARESDALRNFAAQSGVDITTLTREDLVSLARLWSRSNLCTRLDKTLICELPDAPVRYEPGSVRFALFLMTSFFVCLAIIGAGVWRFFS